MIRLLLLIPLFGLLSVPFSSRIQFFRLPVFLLVSVGLGAADLRGCHRQHCSGGQPRKRSATTSSQRMRDVPNTGDPMPPILAARSRARLAVPQPRSTAQR